MRTEDIIKVTEANFCVLRPQDQPEPCIQIYTESQGWTTVKTYPTKEARDKDLNEHLKSRRNILD